MKSSIVLIACFAILAGTQAASPALAETNPDHRKSWDKLVKQVPATDSLVVQMPFFRSQLNSKGKLSVRSHASSFGDALVIAEHMRKAAGKLKGNAQGKAESAWKRELAKIENDFEVGKLTAEAELGWMRFLRSWEREALQQDKNRFPDALRQAGPMIAGVLLDVSMNDIQNAMVKSNVDDKSDECLFFAKYGMSLDSDDYDYLRMNRIDFSRYNRKHEKSGRDRQRDKDARTEYEKDRACLERERERFEKEKTRFEEEHGYSPYWAPARSDYTVQECVTTNYCPPCRPILRSLRWLVFCR